MKVLGLTLIQSLNLVVTDPSLSQEVMDPNLSWEVTNPSLSQEVMDPNLSQGKMDQIPNQVSLVQSLDKEVNLNLNHNWMHQSQKKIHLRI